MKLQIKQQCELSESIKEGEWVYHIHTFTKVKGEVQQIPTPIMFLDNLNQNIKSGQNPKFYVKISFFAAIIDILNFACDVISVPLPENIENFLYNQLITGNIEGVVFHETF